MVITKVGIPSGRTPPAVEQCNCFVVRKAARRISRFYDSQLQPSGLRITQFLILADLHEVGRATMTALADRLDLEHTAIGKMAGTLERDGLVSVTRSPTDGRSRIVELTAAGAIRLADAVPMWRQAQRRFEELNGTATIDALRADFDLP